MAAADLTTQYELDNGHVLAASAGELTTYYLYGLGLIGELTTIGLTPCPTAPTPRVN